MLAVNATNVKQDFKEWCDKVNRGETVVMSQPHNENIYMINGTKYNELQNAYEMLQKMKVKSTSGALETELLLSDPELAEKLMEGKKTPLSECVPDSEVIW